MNMDQITLLKDRVAKSAAALCILFLLCTFDGGQAYLREPFNSLRMLPGESKKLTGPMAPGVFGLEGMTSEESSDSISMSLDQVISGFWLGVKMWRGTLTLRPDIEPGNYMVSVFGTEDQKKVGSNTFQVVVYKDRAARLADSKSFLLRYGGISPWIVAGSFFVLVLITCGGLYLVTGKRDSLMAEQGEAEIYHIARDALGLSIYFGLGKRNGVEKGSHLSVMNSKGQSLEEVRVESASETDGMARVGPLCEVRTGDRVKRR